MLKILPERYKVERDNQISTSLAKSLTDEDRQQRKLYGENNAKIYRSQTMQMKEEVSNR